ncbi:hypothetical protein ABK040_014488 [Willaertia magna]
MLKLSTTSTKPLLQYKTILVDNFKFNNKLLHNKNKHFLSTNFNKLNFNYNQQQERYFRISNLLNNSLNNEQNSLKSFLNKLNKFTFLKENFNDNDSINSFYLKWKLFLFFTSIVSLFLFLFKSKNKKLKLSEIDFTNLENNLTEEQIQELENEVHLLKDLIKDKIDCKELYNEILLRNILYFSLQNDKKFFFISTYCNRLFKLMITDGSIKLKRFIYHFLLNEQLNKFNYLDNLSSVGNNYFNYIKSIEMMLDLQLFYFYLPEFKFLDLNKKQEKFKQDFPNIYNTLINIFIANSNDNKDKNYKNPTSFNINIKSNDKDYNNDKKNDKNNYSFEIKIEGLAMNTNENELILKCFDDAKKRNLNLQNEILNDNFNEINNNNLLRNIGLFTCLIPLFYFKKRKSFNPLFATFVFASTYFYTLTEQKGWNKLIDYLVERNEQSLSIDDYLQRKNMILDVQHLFENSLFVMSVYYCGFIGYILAYFGAKMSK